MSVPLPYWPAAHAVHVLAPVLAPVFVIDPAAQLVQAAQIRAGLVAARKRELFLVSAYFEETRAICTALENQHANAEVDAVAACDNCLAAISAAQLIACRPGPRSDALLHCPTCAVNPNLH